IENMERDSVVIESIRAHRQAQAVHGKEADAVVALHRLPAGRKTDVGTVNFDETSRGATRQPAKKIDHPLPAIGSFPGCASAFVVAKQRLGLRSNRHLLVITF